MKLPSHADATDGEKSPRSFVVRLAPRPVVIATTSSFDVLQTGF
jgi:hypothetical protein